MNPSEIDPAVWPCIFWYALSIYPLLKGFTQAQRNEIAIAATDASLHEPLLMRQDNGRFPIFTLPYFPPDRSGPYVAAVMSALLIYEQRETFGDEAHIPDSLLLNAADAAYAAWKQKSIYPGVTVDEGKFFE